MLLTPKMTLKQLCGVSAGKPAVLSAADLASLSLLRNLAGMLETRGEESYQAVDLTNSCPKEEMNQKKCGISYGMHM